SRAAPGEPEPFIGPVGLDLGSRTLQGGSQVSQQR
ncbi:unnamed protein product, partial [Gulo gulo]